MTRAEWRRRPDDPSGPFGWWWRSVVERRALLLALLPFGVCIVVGLAGGGWGWLLLAGANAFFVSGRSPRKADRLTPLLPDPPPMGQFRASVAFRQQDVTTGTDEMGLVVVEGWLYAEGTRARFAFRREHLSECRTGSESFSRLILPDASEIRLFGIDETARIALERWWQAKALGQGEPTLPPARVHPQESAWHGSVAIAGALLSGVGAFVHFGGWLGFLLRQGTWLAGSILCLVAASRWWRLVKIDVLEQEREKGRAPG